MALRDDLLAHIATKTADYRQGEVPAPTPAHVDRWVQQFPECRQQAVLQEMAHVLDKSYVSRDTFSGWIDHLVTNDAKFAGGDLRTFWSNVEFIERQGGGTSLTNMVAMVRAALLRHYGPLAPTQFTPPTHLYMDDVSYSGQRVISDVQRWIIEDAPADASLKIFTFIAHRYGLWRSRKLINDTIERSGKTIRYTWWYYWQFEDRKRYTDQSDVLRPTFVGNDAAVAAYTAGLRYDVVYRQGDALGEKAVFSSPQGRETLEHELLHAGLRVRAMCPHFGPYHRPLGFTNLDTLGFGSTIVTYRNCPNNAPLALWASAPWYPLFQRRNN